MRILLLLTVSLLWLSGCAYQNSSAPQGSWQAQKNTLEQLEQWQLTARLGIITKDDRGSLSLFWRQNHANYRMNLTNVVGKRVFDISQTPPHAVTLIDSDGKTHNAENARDLVYSLTGWDLPVEQLSYWIKGLPGKADSVTYDDNGRPKTIQSHGWQLRYAGYTQINGLWLPSGLELNHENTTLKLAISEWELN